MRDKICFALCQHDGYDAGEFVRSKCRCGVDIELKDPAGKPIEILTPPLGL
jgi:hypothetical protein